MIFVLVMCVIFVEVLCVAFVHDSVVDLTQGEHVCGHHGGDEGPLKPW